MRAHDCKVIKILLVSCVLRMPIIGQTPTRPAFTKHAALAHVNGQEHVIASDPRPLFQAVEGLATEYGLLFDYEDPPYSSSRDLVDNTAPEWRAEHPGERGVRRVAGTTFACVIPEITDVTNSLQHQQVLGALVTAYNATQNPGSFGIHPSVGRIAVVGTATRNDGGSLVATTPALDTPVSLSANEGTLWGALLSVLHQVSVTIGVKITPGEAPMGIFATTQTTVVIDNQSARSAIIALFNASGQKLVYGLLYDADANQYFLNIAHASRVTIGPYGARQYHWIP